MPGETKRSSFSRITRKSIEFLKKTFSRSTQKVKVSPRNHTIEIVGKKFKNQKELLQHADQEIKKVIDKYNETIANFDLKIKLKIRECHAMLESEEDIKDFDKKFSNKLDEIVNTFNSLRFLKSPIVGVESADDKEEHNEEDFELFCKSKKYFNFITSDKSAVPKEFLVRKDGSRRENKISSKVIYMISYLPMITVAYEKDKEKAEASLKKAFEEIDKYMQEYETKKRWSKKPQKLRDRQMILGNGKNYSANKAWNKKPQAPTTLKFRKKLIGSARASKQAQALMKEAEKEKQAVQQDKPRLSSSRSNVVGRRKSNITFSKNSTHG